MKKTFDTVVYQKLISAYHFLRTRDERTMRPGTTPQINRLARRAGIISSRQQRRAIKALRRQQRQPAL